MLRRTWWNHASSKPGRFRVSPRTGPHRLLDQLDEARSVDELDRVLGGELLRGQREAAGRDEEPLVTLRVVNRAEKLLELGRADNAPGVVLALNDPDQSALAQDEV